LPVAAGLHHLLYVVIYTMWLKRSTPQEHRHRRRGGCPSSDDRLGGRTGAVGMKASFPVPDHLSSGHRRISGRWLFKAGDYAAAGIDDAERGGQARPEDRYFAYSLLLAPIGVLPWAVGFASGVLCPLPAAFGRGFHLARLEGSGLSRQGDEALQRRCLPSRFSIFFAIFAMLLADTIAMRAFMPTGG